MENVDKFAKTQIGRRRDPRRQARRHQEGGRAAKARSRIQAGDAEGVRPLIENRDNHRVTETTENPRISLCDLVSLWLFPFTTASPALVLFRPPLPPMTTATASLSQLAINTIRTLSMDAVEAANSGHPGTPMALAPVAYVLWNEVLRYDPAQPLWPGRDRFVLSCGHASMLLYSVLHLAGVRQVGHVAASLRDASASLGETRPRDELAVPLDEISNSASCTAAPPAIPSTATPPAWRPPPARWARAAATASAWPSPRGGWPPATTGPASSCSTSTSTPCAATAT